MSFAVQKRLFAALMFLPLLVLATATGSVGLRCTITGEVLSACCCGAGAGPPTEEVPSTLSQADCCDRIVRDVAAQAAEVTSSERLLPDHVATFATVALGVATISMSPADVRPDAVPWTNLRPPTGRLRLLAKSSFLI